MKVTTNPRGFFYAVYDARTGLPLGVFDTVYDVIRFTGMVRTTVYRAINTGETVCGIYKIYKFFDDGLDN